MSKAIKVSIIIVNWNHPQDTIKCLSSLSKLVYPSSHIIVVDNGSDDNSVSLITEKFPSVELLLSKENRGFAGGNNLGIKKALKDGAEYILLLNNDTVVDPSFLKPLVTTLEENSSLGIVGPVIYQLKDKNKVWWAGGKLDFWLNFHPDIKIPQEKVKLINFQTGCCMLIKKEVFTKIGLMDENYFLYYEDTDFCYRIQKNGYQIGLVSNSKIWHQVSATTKGNQNFLNEYYYIRNKLKFAKKNFPRIKWFIFFILYTIKIGIKLIVSGRQAKKSYTLKAYQDFLRNYGGKFNLS